MGPRTRLSVARSVPRRENLGIGRLSSLRKCGEDERIRVGIGIRCGPTVLGRVGTSERIEPTVTADAVNVAARLERLTRSLGAPIIISGRVCDLLPKNLQKHCRALGLHAVPGKAEPIACWSVAADLSPQSEAQDHHTATPRRPTRSRPHTGKVRKNP